MQSEKTDCLARREVVPFYRFKGMVYNAWFTGMSSPYISSDEAFPGRFTNNLHWKTHMSIGAR
jgi:hypothetical protein